MKIKKVSIVYTGTGNIRSLTHWFESASLNIEVISTAKEWKSPEFVALPGVGAFQTAMTQLRKCGLIDPLLKHLSSGRPFLGICLGMQLMLDSSEEFGITSGLGVIQGRVVRIPSGYEGIRYKVPHIGWSKVYLSQEALESRKLSLAFSSADPSFYFLHSYFCKLEENVSSPNR